MSFHHGLRSSKISDIRRLVRRAPGVSGDCPHETFDGSVFIPLSGSQERGFPINRPPGDVAWIFLIPALLFPCGSRGGTTIHGELSIKDEPMYRRANFRGERMQLTSRVSFGYVTRRHASFRGRVSPTCCVPVATTHRLHRSRGEAASRAEPVFFYDIILGKVYDIVTQIVP